ncbi:MAG TPA: sodium:solute symporter [Chitinophagaceae bacterium]|nr:sodium:solute symporter [Chitinophagaceae bacterium]
MHATYLFLIILAYFSLLMLISYLTSRRSRDTTYFDGNRESPWMLVAFGMIGSGISAVSLVSIPGDVGNNNLYFFQFILGTLAGNLFIAYLLIPVYFRLRVVSIYTYLDVRFDPVTYRTGSLFFLVSQSFGAALRLLLSVKILQYAFFDALHIPYWLTIVIVLILIWLYTNKSGIKTIVWTDALQSLFLVTVILLSLLTIRHALGLSFGGMIRTILDQPRARLFDWNSQSGTHFVKQFLSGFLITVALVGLDQSMMQKTLTVSGERNARRNVLSFGFFIAFAQTLFLGLGVLMYFYAEQKGIPLPRAGGRYLDTDAVYPLLTLHYFGPVGALAFLIAVIASTFASIDACITALTTSFSYDFLSMERIPHARRTRVKNRVLLGVNLVMFAIVMLFWNSRGAIITTIFKIAGYTYGPLLGLYLLGLFSRVSLKGRWVPAACVAAALLTYLVNGYLLDAFGFDVGFMNIFINAALTLVFLLVIKKSTPDAGPAGL